MPESVIATMLATLAQVETLSTEHKVALLMALLAQEVCTLPPGERRAMVQDITDDFPEIFDVTERAMRKALAENARGKA